MKVALLAFAVVFLASHATGFAPVAGGTHRSSRLRMVVADDLTLCSRCNTHFRESTNADDACRYHTAAYAGEDSQRWTAPGAVNPGTVAYSWLCCGAEGVDAPGCAVGRCVGY